MQQLFWAFKKKHVPAIGASDVQLYLSHQVLKVMSTYMPI